MWKKTILTVLLTTLFVSSLYAMPVEVTIRNGTTRDVLPNYPFTIHMLNKTGKEASKLDLRTDSKGLYRGDLPFGKDTVLLARATYRGVTYETTSFKKIKDTLVAELTVYEITDRADNITIPHRTLVVSPQNDHTVQVFEIIQLKNKGTRTFVGRYNDELDTHQVLYIPMPLGYRLNHLQGIDSRKVLTYNRAIITEEKLPPGEREIVLGYLLRSDTGLFDLSLVSDGNKPEPEQATVLLLKNNNWRLKSGALEFSGETDFYGKLYQSWTGKGSDILKIKLYSPAYRDRTFTWAIAIIGGVLLSAMLMFLGGKRIRLYYTLKEKDRIMNTLSALKATGGEDGYYQPIIKILEERLSEINRRMAS